MNYNFRLYGGAVILLIPLALFLFPVRAVAVPSLLALVLACSLNLAAVLERRKSPRVSAVCSGSTSFFYSAGAELALVTTALRQDKRPNHAALPNLHRRSDCFFSTRFEEI